MNELLTVKCELCGCEINKDDSYEFDDVIMCEDCHDDNIFYCDDCNECHWTNNGTYLEKYDRYICDDCLENNYFECSDCGEWIRYNDYYNYRVLANGNRICLHCYEWGEYFCCNECGEIFHNDDSYYNDEDDCYYCYTCYNSLKNRAIHDYYYKPEPIFYKTNKDRKQRPLYMGIELEVDGGGEDNEKAQTILNIFNNDNELVYIKHDGSLDYGFEIVSHPATLNYHLNNVKWLEAFPKLIDMEYRSHDTNSCGLHIHVSRDAFGKTFEESENNIAKVLYFIENNWNEVLRFTRRTEYKMERWASRYGLEKDSKELYKKAKNDDYNRYRCINLLNSNTIEFRIFRGTLNPVTFNATLQFVNVLCELCVKRGSKYIENLTWYEFTQLIDTKKYIELIEYLKIRNLY